MDHGIATEFVHHGVFTVIFYTAAAGGAAVTIFLYDKSRGFGTELIFSFG